MFVLRAVDTHEHFYCRLCEGLQSWLTLTSSKIVCSLLLMYEEARTHYSFSLIGGNLQGRCDSVTVLGACMGTATYIYVHSFA